MYPVRAGAVRPRVYADEYHNQHIPQEKNRYKNSFILKYKLDYCASGVHDRGKSGKAGKRDRGDRRVTNQLGQKMLAKERKKEKYEERGWGWEGTGKRGRTGQRA